jgi:hypothetical protein
VYSSTQKRNLLTLRSSQQADNCEVPQVIANPANRVTKR